MSIASEHLHLSPQGLSMAIKSLEDELGIILLKRDSRGTSLTEAGKRLTALTESFFNELSAIQNEFKIYKKIANLNNDICIYLPEAMLDGILIKALSNVYKSTSVQNISLNVIKYEEILDKIIAKDIPYSFYCHYTINEQTGNDFLGNNIVFEPIFSSEVYCCVNRAHHLAKKKKVSLESLSSETIILMKNFEFIAKQILSTLQANPKIIFSPSLRALNEMLYTNVGATFSGLPYFSNTKHVFSSNFNKYSIYNNDSCLNIPFEEDIIYEVGYIHLKDQLLDNDNQCVINLIIDELKNYMTN